MAVKDVTILRKSGKLIEAYKLAKQELSEDPNQWTRMSMFWVLRDLAQSVFIPKHDVQKARACLSQMHSLLPLMVDDSGAGEKALKNLLKQLQPNADLIKSASELSKSDPTTAYNNVVSAIGSKGESIDKSLHEDFGWIIYRYIKADGDKLKSTKVRGLLRDYILLSNDRPSMLHSMILNYALNYSKSHLDFSLYNFLKMWGIENLRSEDFNDGWVDGHNIPSLVSRICKALIDCNADFDIKEFIDSFDKRRQTEVLEYLRQNFFWKLMNLQKSNDTSTLFTTFEEYARKYSAFSGTHWHSEILKIANRFYSDDNSTRFFSFTKCWLGNGNFLDEDWKKEKSEDGTEYQSLVVKTAKRCYAALKNNTQLRSDLENVEWLKALYKCIYERDSNDDWSIRNYATLCKWSGNIDEAIDVYKKLLLDMGEKYYLWAELADCITSDNFVRTGLLLKSLKLEHNEDFLGEIHISLAKAWVEEGYGINAKNELDLYVKHREEKGWNISEECQRILNNLSNISSSKQENLNQYIRRAEDFVYDKFDWKDYVLTDKWTFNDVERCSFYDGESISFSVKIKRFPILRKCQVGDVISWRCKVSSETISDPNFSAWLKRTITKTTINPLLAKRSQQKRWSTLPLKYGVIDYINIEKHVLHIITQDNVKVFCPVGKHNYDIGEFVSFRQYEKEKKDEKVTCAADVKPCSKDEALPNMPTRIVVVDDVNDSKKLFHVVLGLNKVSDIVKYSETNIRPQIGDFLRIIYYIKTSKEGKKRIKFLDVKTSDVGCSGVKGTVTGRLSLKYRDDHSAPDFAFLKDFYVHRNLLRKYNITTDCELTAKVVLGGDNKWKVYDLELPNGSKESSDK